MPPTFRVVVAMCGVGAGESDEREALLLPAGGTLICAGAMSPLAAMERSCGGQLLCRSRGRRVSAKDRCASEIRWRLQCDSRHLRLADVAKADS